ncbi:MAG: tetratricopeptide repeat protein [Lacipirellulaceae bacterium]
MTHALPIHRAISVALALVATSWAASRADRVWKLSGSESGSLRSVTREGVTLDRDGAPVFTPIEDVRWVQFDDEPPELTQARLNVAAGGYKTALKKLQSIGLSPTTNPRVAADLEFYSALCVARLALAGEREVTEGGRALAKYLATNTDTHHSYEAIATLGDLLAALGRTDKAVEQYDKLAASERPAVRARGGVLAGRALALRGDHVAAIKRFDGVRAIDDESPPAAAERFAAACGKGASLAASGDLEGGLKIVRSLVFDARAAAESPEREARLAAAHNALGACYEGAGDERAALFARLHVDYAYDGDANTHAEALAKLVRLWRAAGEAREAADAEQRLRRKYGASPWARRSPPSKPNGAPR